MNRNEIHLIIVQTLDKLQGEGLLKKKASDLSIDWAYALSVELMKRNKDPALNKDLGKF